jgi:hypothetical protein
LTSGSKSTPVVKKPSPVVDEVSEEEVELVDTDTTEDDELPF